VIAHARAKYEAHQRKVHLSEKDLRDRAIKGWETRRRNNPALKNIHRVGKKDFEWHRPNGEKVPLRNFTADQVELVAPAMHVTDIHLKHKQKLHTSISVDPMRMHNFKARFTGYRTGGDMMPLRAAGVSDTNPVRLNRHSLRNPSPSFAPAGILTHEIGHLVGPGTDTYLGSSPHKPKGHSKKEVEHFEKSFQWEAPRVKPVKGIKNAFKLDRNGDLDPHFTNYESLWDITAKHPQSVAAYTSGDRKGLSRAWYNAYQTTNISEDFAETYRSTVGVPMDTDGKPKGVHWDWKDRKNMRRAYMEKTHLSKAARHNQYVKLIQEATDRHNSE
jgi:hypothetical protein